jgi:hypothetical protein
MMWKLLSFHAAPLLEKVHPLEGGIFRRKYRKDRRYGMPLENPLVFSARYIGETIAKYVRFLVIYLRYRRTLQRCCGIRNRIPMWRWRRLRRLSSSSWRSLKPPTQRGQRRKKARRRKARLSG